MELTNQDGDDDRNGPLENLVAPTGEPSSLEDWAEFHKRVEELPDKKREVFRLRWYYDASTSETAEALRITIDTVNRRWRQATQSLFEGRNGRPGSD